MLPTQPELTKKMLAVIFVSHSMFQKLFQICGTGGARRASKEKIKIFGVWICEFLHQLSGQQEKKKVDCPSEEHTQVQKSG